MKRWPLKISRIYAKDLRMLHPIGSTDMAQIKPVLTLVRTFESGKPYDTLFHLLCVPGHDNSNEFI